MRVTPAGVVVGRSSGCDVVLPVRGVSRRHCRLTATPGGIVVDDLESSRGTTVNGAPAPKPAWLKHGDLLGIAHLTFRVEVRA